ncbi:10970_t:CDS:1 [Dentiscutata erythropus]|uniref:10970_t:CDS:1 n=1 Tax=Dentiscutata erythropus TaxID=1348616 RepID=A0A9N9NRZ7_9GLOM|nr:10970_t:CDS:1 [Dentiscutata erythropus]
MDFITNLPSSSGFDSIFVVVDRLTKMAHFIAYNKNVNTEQTARLIFQEVVRLHGAPEEIILDRGPQFASKFWKQLFKLLGMKVNLSSAYHPQMDGQSERVNQILKQYLCYTINYYQNDWAKLLSFAEFAYNNFTHLSTQTAPFLANYRFHLCFDVQSSVPASVPSAKTTVVHLQKIQEKLVDGLGAIQE